MKVAVIGAGPSGLPAIKQCLDEGLRPVCFEKRQSVGGVWNYEETPTKGQTSVMLATVSNTSKETLCYSDFPTPEDFPNFFYHSKLLEYLKLYAKHFDLEKYIRFRTEVVEVIQSDDFNVTGQWVVRYRDSASGSLSSELFDAVLVCNGHFDEPLTPQFEGAATFKGKQIHAQMYKTSAGFERKRVVVVGLGNTGGDVASDLAHVCSQVFVSMRKESWIVPRLIAGGLTFESVAFNRFANSLPRFLRNYLTERLLMKNFDHSLYGIKPDHPFDTQQLFLNDELPKLLAAGRVVFKGDIRAISETSITFKDGSKEDKIDAIIYATGARLDFPFIKHPSYKVDDDNFIDLYKLMFAPDVKPHTLAIIGCVQSNGSLFPISELQSRLAVQVFKGEKILPTEERMKKEIEQERVMMRTRYLHGPRYTTHRDWINFMDEIASTIGVKPNYVKMFVTDPRLALAVFFGPCIPSHYRLMGKGAWPGARNTILTTWDRMRKPLQKKGEQTKKANHKSSWPIIMCGFVSIGALVALYAAKDNGFHPRSFFEDYIDKCQSMISHYTGT